MECVQSDLWRVVLAESARAYTFKFLINDTTWSAGPDFTAACGTSVTLTPEFCARHEGVVPGRYLHTAASIIRLSDWQNTLSLAYHALTRLSPELLQAER